MSSYTITLYGMTIIGLQLLVVGALVYAVHRLASGFGDYANALRDERAESKRLTNLYTIVLVDNQRLADALAACERQQQPPPREKSA